MDRGGAEKKHVVFPQGIPPYNTTIFLTRYSTQDAMVQYEGNSYSVPPVYARKKLLVRRISEYGKAFIEIYWKKVCIAKHKISFERGKWICSPTHITNTQFSQLSGRQHNYKQGGKSVENKSQQKDWKEVGVPARDLTYYDFFIETYVKSN